MICRWLHGKCPSGHCPRWFDQYYFSSWYWSCTDDCMVNGDHRMLLWSPDQLPNGFLPGRRQSKVSRKMLRKIILVIIIQIWKMIIIVVFENYWFSLGIYQWLLGSNLSTIVPWLLIVEVKNRDGVWYAIFIIISSLLAMIASRMTPPIWGPFQERTDKD